MGAGQSSDDAPILSAASNLLMCGHRREPPSYEYDYRPGPRLKPSSSFGALQHSNPVDLVAAWVLARERGDVEAATNLCAEDLRFEVYGEGDECYELAGRDTIAEEVFQTPAPSFEAADVYADLHLVAKSGGGERGGTSAYVVARDLRLPQHRLRQEFTVISLKGWKNAMIILRIVVTRRALRDDEGDARSLLVRGA